MFILFTKFNVIVMRRLNLSDCNHTVFFFFFFFLWGGGGGDGVYSRNENSVKLQYLFTCTCSNVLIVTPYSIV